MPRGPRAPHDLYSPERPTAVVLSGVGADGAYHAGVLKALHEAAVKVDLVAGRGVGALGAALFAVDGAAALWEPLGFWQRPALAAHLPASPGATARLALMLTVTAALVASPLLLLAGAALVWPVALGLGLLGLESGAALAARLWRAGGVGLCPGPGPDLGAAPGAAGVGEPRRRAGRGRVCGRAYLAPRRHAGGALWRLVGAPVDSRTFAGLATGALWDLLRGGAKLARPGPHDLSQRYAELLAASLGQPGHRDLLLAVHDLDARRDLVFGAGRRRSRQASVPRPDRAPAARRAEAFDLGADARSLLVDVVAAAATLPAASDPHALRFPGRRLLAGRGRTAPPTDRRC